MHHYDMKPAVKLVLSRQELEQSIAMPRFMQLGPFVLAFVFAHPDSDTMQMVDAGGDYFDQRTGDTWDLFFPGYYKSSKVNHSGKPTRSRRVGRCYTNDWYFSANGFNMLREYVERSSAGRWQYSGDVDLVLVNGWRVEGSDPIVDWVSTISGQITDQMAGTKTLTLGGVVERITRDIQAAAEDPSYVVGVLTHVSATPDSHIVRDFMINALGGIAAALGAKAFGG